ncbi:hypothetical protein KC331_g10177 [Hortaea werneckii]|uniref:C2H2-type domain-containing protein n=1 Tax=Hortaea werneckii TaxID=91943 RepID=A0A3M7CUX8_HORWE|nr:hypothetical protein KC331_g10177 [Hortaea werneckii]RMY55958.1 hypothetical protein D0865_03902 [Hortaea werneckii]
MAAVVAYPVPQKRKASDAVGEGTSSSSSVTAKRARCDAKDDADTETIPADDSGKQRDHRYEEVSPPGSRPPSVAATEISKAETTASGYRRPKKYICDQPNCGKAFDRPIKLQVHIRSHTNERPFACEEPGCDKTFQRSEHLKRHVRDTHCESPGFICEYVLRESDNSSPVKCGKGFTTVTRLRRHMAIHEKKEETRCQEPGCGKVFRKQETLQRHIKADHLGEKAYQCTHVETNEDGVSVECGKAFSKPELLRNHEAREHSGNRYFCDICPVTEEPNDDLVDEMETLAKCETRVGFSTYTDLQLHIRTVHPPTCTQCGKECESNRALNAHVDIEHTSLSERQTFKCTWPGCDRGFTKSGNLKVHMQNVHAKARNFICGQFDMRDNQKTQGWNGIGCGMGFGTKANLEEHVRTQHLGFPSKIRPCRRKKANGSSTPSTMMDVDELATPSIPAAEPKHGALSMLTGHGYDEIRPIPCMIHGCPNRFTKDYELATHLELTHGWQVDDVNDRIAERRALEGGQFWLGGAEQIDAEYHEDEALREKLEDILRPGSRSEPLQAAGAGDLMSADQGFPADIEKQREQQPLAVNGTLGEDGEAMVLDPALMT